MTATVTHIDLSDGKVVVHFDNGEAALFDPGFLFENRNSNGNRIVANDDELE